MISQPLSRNGENGANGLHAPAHLVDLGPNPGLAHAVNQLLGEMNSALVILLSLKTAWRLSVQVFKSFNYYQYFGKTK